MMPYTQGHRGTTDGLYAQSEGNCREESFLCGKKWVKQDKQAKQV
jgi:hypothetical protein